MGRPIKDPLQKLDRALAELLLKLIRKGRPKFTGDGQPVVDELGNPVTAPASAADIKAAIDYLGAVGYFKGQGGEPAGGVHELVEHLKERRQLPQHLQKQADEEKARQREERARLDRGLARVRNDNLDRVSQPIKFPHGGASA